jgi:hypothetical protein
VKAAVPVVRAAEMVRAAEQQWSEEAPTTSERTTRILERSKELVDIFAKRGLVGFEERLKSLMAETTQELITSVLAVATRNQASDRAEAGSASSGPVGGLNDAKHLSDHPPQPGNAQAPADLRHLVPPHSERERVFEEENAETVIKLTQAYIRFCDQNENAITIEGAEEFIKRWRRGRGLGQSDDQRGLDQERPTEKDTRKAMHRLKAAGGVEVSLRNEDFLTLQSESSPSSSEQSEAGDDPMMPAELQYRTPQWNK